MDPEFYHKNIFGDVVDVAFGAEEELEDNLGPKTGPDFSIFTLTDTLAAKKKKEAWVLYQKALAAGVTAEEIFWRFAWQVRTLLLAGRTKSAAEVDMKAFPYNKAKSHLKNWKTDELENLSEKLVVGYHQTRLGKEEMETFLEKLLLNL